MPSSERDGRRIASTAFHDAMVSLPMARVGLVAPTERLRRVLVETADAGVFEPDLADGEDAGSTTRATETDPAPVDARLSERPLSDDDLAATGRSDLVAGERQLRRVVDSAIDTDRCTIVTGWLPRRDVDTLRSWLAPHGGAVVELAARRGLIPPTAHGDRRPTAALRPLVSTYATVPYHDIDPTWFAGIAYMAMFGMMFGDVGHGLALIALGVAGLVTTRPSVARLRQAAPFLIGAGVASVLFGFLYGEALGPTGLVPTLWIRPLDEPETLLLAGLIGGAGLLALTFILAIVDRWREGGPPLALYAASGIGGALLFAGTAAAIGGVIGSLGWLWPLGLAIAGAGVVLTFTGLVVEAGTGGAAIAQAVVEMLDTVLRLGSNVVSFTRLAAFGLTHAVIGEVVWDGTVGLWNRAGAVAIAAAVLLFAVGNLVAFGLGALVGAIQALRLEYYELFSRLFATEGRPFEPWYLPIERTEPSCPPGPTS